MVMNCLMLDPKDSVAVVLDNLKSGDIAAIREPNQKMLEVKIIQDVPRYHKVATANIQAGDLIYKYGQVIGKASQDIQVGEHVHSHNLVSIREGIG